MPDLPERLRGHAALIIANEQRASAVPLLKEAADRIEELEKELGRYEQFTKGERSGIALFIKRREVGESDE